MNRRSFLKTLATATAGFTILPSATTYQRIWKAQTQIVNPKWINEPYERWAASFDPAGYFGDWQWIEKRIQFEDGQFSQIRFFDVHRKNLDSLTS